MIIEAKNELINFWHIEEKKKKTSTKTQDRN